MSVEDRDDNISYSPVDTGLFEAISLFLQPDGQTPEPEVLLDEARFSADAKDVLMKLGFVFLRVGGESVRVMKEKGIEIDIGEHQETLAFRAWKKVLPRREIAINRRQPFYPIQKGTYKHLVEEVARYSKDGLPFSIRDEAVATLGQPVTIIDAMLEYERKQEAPIDPNIRVCSEIIYPGSGMGVNYVIQVGYQEGMSGIGKITTSSVAETMISESLRGLIILEKRSILELIAAA